MIISHKYKFIFIKTKKTAGTSIEVYLSQFCGNNDIVTTVYPSEKGHIPKNYHGLFNLLIEVKNCYKGMSTIRTYGRFIKLIRYYEHIHANNLKNRLKESIWNNYYKFCVDRNPWDKVVSKYCMINYRNNGKIDFDNYIINGVLPYNLHYYSNPDGSLLVDKVIKYENLNDELSAVFKKLTIPFNGELKVRSKAHYRKDKSHYREFYDNNTRKLVEELFREEINLHGYKF